MHNDRLQRGLAPRERTGMIGDAGTDPATGVEAPSSKGLFAKAARGEPGQGKLPALDLGNVVVQAKACHRAKRKFTKLTKPRRPPLPGSATPAGYVINRRCPPADATRAERYRDVLLDLGTHWAVSVLQLLWLVALVAVFVVFACCLMYWFGWGEETDDGWGCTSSFVNMSCCTCHPPALTYKLEDYWQERMAQGLSALFTYSVLLATPWRLSILVQCFDNRCKDNRCGGVDFFGKPNEMPFFHIPWRPRLAISLLLNLNTLFQLVQQVLKIVWLGVVNYFEQPQGYIGLATGPIAGCVLGVSAAAVQVYWDYVLHLREPARFPPGCFQAVRNYLVGDKQEEEEEMEMSATAATSTAAPPPAVDVNNA